MKKFIVLLLLLLACRSAHAACAGGSPLWTTTPDSASVQTCINSAVVGDIISISAGAAAWTSASPVVLSKAITLLGAGAGALVGAGASAPTISLTGSGTFHITKQAGGVTRIQNLIFTSSSKVVPHLVTIDGPWPSGQPVIFQNDTITLSNADFTTIGTAGGVIFSHILYTGLLGDTLMTGKDTGSTSSWTTADTMGSRDTTGFNNIYIEDSTFNGGTITDCDQQCRAVMRHNTLNDSGGFNSHGWDSSPSSMRHFEIYSNHFFFPDKTCTNGNNSLSNINQYIWIRGGTGVIYNNDFDPLFSSCWGDKAEMKFSARGAEDDRPQGTCAQVSYPVPQQIGQNFNGSAYFTDPIYLWGNTSNGGADPNGPWQIAVSAGWGWNNPCFTTYQTNGWGNTNGQQWSHFFQWGRDAANTAVGVNLCDSGSLGCTVDGIGGAAKPGYTAFTYPHPLVSNLSAAPNPLNFGNITTLATSGAMTVTVTNSSGSSVVLATPFFTLTTGNPGDFTKTGGSCANGGTITAGSNCTATFTATPAVAGLRQTLLTISLNPAGASATSTLQVTGVAVGTPAVTLTTGGNPASPFNFGTVNTGTLSPAQTFTLLNSGNASLTITSIVSSDPVSFPISGSTCGGSLAAAGTCTFNDTCSPAVPAAAQTATITVTTNAPEVTDVINLSCTGFTPLNSPPPISSNPIISAVPLPPQPTIVSVSPATTYVAKQGCSQDGHGWANPCTFRVLCTDCSSATLLSLDGASVVQSYAAGVMTATVPLSALPVPSTVTAHSFAAVNPIPIIN